MDKDAALAPRLRRLPVRLVDAALRTVRTVTSAATEWTGEVEDWFFRADKYWRLATHQVTVEELLRWTAGELGELDAMYLKNLLLTEERNLREADAEARKLITSIGDDEIDRLLAEIRKDQDGGDR